ncbi:acylphosphatase [Salipaludibacillus neizhouensis]|uniref:Acylphosphatase n=1 Tax=Salipaludibacillus neizhouensis TaxID=885475 RepID=A0A3A9K0B0_9BACI|nr:acylphosphatase [Salipaludibacillus neizhouensis]RKL66167.1 acylphosphatase [Salipaludibacillus neizhouensis]
MERYHVQVKGTVQGVGFRYTAQMKATERHLTGWVKNKLDGTVELEVQGESSKIHSFIESLSEFKFPAKVENIEKVSIPTLSKEDTFSITH